MRIPKAMQTETAQHSFEAALVIVMLLILPSLPLGKYGGGLAMMVFGIVGLIAYFVLFGERLRSRGQLKTVTFALALGAVIAVLLTRWSWH